MQKRAGVVGLGFILRAVLGIASLLIAADCAKAPLVDPFAPAPVKWSDADRAWRPVALATLFSWYNAFVGQFPRTVVLVSRLPYLEDNRFYTAAELQEVMPASTWRRLVAQHLNVPANPTSTAVVFINNPLSDEDAAQSHDLLGQAAALSAAKQVPFALDSGTRALAEYRWFVQQRRLLDASRFPPSLQLFVQRELDRVVVSLPEPLRQRASGAKVSFQVPPGAGGFIIAHAALSKEITLSPLLVRTLFIREVSRCAPIQWKFFFPNEGPETAATGQRSLFWSDPKFITDCYATFGALLAFPLAHELAHVFLSDQPSTSLYKPERCPDVFSIGYVVNQGQAGMNSLSDWGVLLKAFDSPEDVGLFGFGTEDSDVERLREFQSVRTRVEAAYRRAGNARSLDPVADALRCAGEEAARGN